MIGWLIKKIRQAKIWRAMHDASWVGFDIAGSDGITAFQSEILESLKGNPGISSVELVRGQKENYYRGLLSTSEAEFFIYSDEAELAGNVYERWGFDSRQELVKEFLTNAEGKNIKKIDN